jgi:hypothetical protein
VSLEELAAPSAAGVGRSAEPSGVRVVETAGGAPARLQLRTPLFASSFGLVGEHLSIA